MKATAALANLRQMLNRKSPETLHRYLGSTIRTGEAAASYRMGDIEAQRLLESVTGLMFVAADKRATEIARYRPRVYRAARGTVTDTRRKLGTKARKKMLASGMFQGKAMSILDGSFEVEQLPDHEIQRVIDRPNAYQSGAEYRRSKEFMLCITGNGYTLKSYEEDGDITQPLSPREGSPVSLYLLPPQYVWPRPASDKSRLVASYHYGRDTAATVDIDATRVLHEKYLASPGDPYRGVGLAWSVLKEHAALQARLTALMALAENNYRPDFLVAIPGMNQTERDNFDKYLESRLGGAHKSGQYLSVGGAEVTVTPLTFPRKDFEEHATDKHLEDKVLSAMGVPAPLVRMNEASFGADQIESAYNQFLRATVRPALGAMCDEINEQLVPDFDDPDAVFVACEDPVPDDRETEDRIWSVRFQNGWPLNEWRAAVGEEPLDDENADRPLFAGQPLAASPFGGPVFGPASTPRIGEPEPQGQPVDEQALNGAQIQQLVAIAERVTQGVLSREAGLAMAEAAFPGVPSERLREIFRRLVVGSQPAPTEEGPSAEASEPNGKSKAGPGDYHAGHAVRGVAGALPQRPSGAGEPAGAGGVAGEVEDGPEDRVPVPDGGGGAKGGGVIEPFFTKSDPWHHCEHRTKDDDRDARLDPASDVLPEVVEDQIEPLARDLEAFFEERLPEAVGRARNTGDVDLTPYEDDLRRLLEPRLRRLFESGADLGLDQLAELGFGDLPTLLPESRAAAYVRQSGPLLARTITDSTQQALTRQVQNALESGLDLRESRSAIQQRIADEGVAAQRAAVIARTEVSSAVEEGRREAFKAGGMTHKWWNQAGGACPICRAMATKYGSPSLAVEIDEPFLKAGDTLQHSGGTYTAWRDVQMPPAHPNCRCSGAPVRRDG